MKKIKSTLLIILLCTGVCSCKQRSNTPSLTATKLSVPTVPAMLTSPEQKAEFVVTHYWDNFNFSDTTLIAKTNYTEQAFADFINLLGNVPVSLVEPGVKSLMNKAAADQAMYAHFMTLSEKYLYEPNSPFHNEDTYILFLQQVLGNSALDDVHKIRPRFQLELALKNRVGEKATDFEYTKENGSKARLYSATGNPLLLFFFRPDCESCKATKEYIKNRHIDKSVKIVFVNPDTDTHLDRIYDLRASPTLYLLDKDKNVLLKDAQIEQIEQYLSDKKS